MAQALSDSVGATKRQIQIWTDAGVIHCLPETDRQGRGRQRLYVSSEKPAAALATWLVKFGLPVGHLIFYASAFRAAMLDEINGVDMRGEENWPKWRRNALTGKHESWIVMQWDGTEHLTPDEGKPTTSFAWCNREHLMERIIHHGEMFLILNVKKSLAPYT